MASPLPSPAETPAPAPPCAGQGRIALCPAMTRCECAGVSFEEVARRIQADGLRPEQAIGGTRCGQTCGACLPDLQQFLAAR
jgi:NAD(P)H-nitrite reductase large subunit